MLVTYHTPAPYPLQLLLVAGTELTQLPSVPAALLLLLVAVAVSITLLLPVAARVLPSCPEPRPPLLPGTQSSLL